MVVYDSVSQPLIEKKNLPGRGLEKFEDHWYMRLETKEKLSLCHEDVWEWRYSSIILSNGITWR
jgi:hypothetical protein